MLRTEHPYEFRKRIDRVHAPFSAGESPRRGEVVVNGSWAISCPGNPSETILMLADDLVDYFRTAAKISLPVIIGGNRGIVLRLDSKIRKKGQFRIAVTEDRIVLSAADARGLRRAGVRLEDRMNLRGGPFLSPGTETRTKLISPRIVHSGWGMELFPDSQLNAVLHAGFDAIAVFTTGFDRTNVGVLDFRDLIDRAAKYDIDFYFYSYLPSYKHPDDPDAEAFFESVYTRLFERYPGAAGIMLVGESTEFPSKDPATTGKTYTQSITDGIPDVKPSPGWWPCKDYPRWLKRVRDAVRKADPEAKIVFNTYNWGYTPLALRREFLRSVPEGITIQVTYDIFSEHRIFGLRECVMDYSVVAKDPGYYFDSECKAAAEFHLPLLATANTAGTTWDFGDVPYVPVPQRWIHRFKKLDHYRRHCHLDAFYDCHHYGWWPSVITELGKAFFTSPQEDPDAVLNGIAHRMAGGGASQLLAAWQCWSDAFDYLPAENEDQYGPQRVGPSYPLIFQPNISRTMADKRIAFPTQEGAHFGNKIILTFYQPYENISQPPASIRYPHELRALRRFLSLWDKGLACYAKAIDAAPADRREALEREYNLGRFIRCAATTTLHTKRWWVLNRDLQCCSTAAAARKKLAELESLLEQEKANAESAIPLVEADSRLGWEPSMEYVCDRWHIEWKLRQLESCRREMTDYAKMLQL